VAHNIQNNKKRACLPQLLHSDKHAHYNVLVQATAQYHNVHCTMTVFENILVRTFSRFQTNIRVY